MISNLPKSSDLIIQKHCIHYTGRIKALCLHSKEPWLLASLFTGQVIIYNYLEKTVYKTFNVSKSPLRSTKWIERKQWFVCCSDDFMIRVYNYNTGEKIKEWEAHSDFVRGLAVNPKLPYLLSCSDDFSIKMWDWEKNWKCVKTFQGHKSFVMQVDWNPKDSNIFSSAALDGMIFVWSTESNNPRFSLNAHKNGVNCVSYYSGKDKPFIVSGGDDLQVKIWDLQNKSLVNTLSGHEGNVNTVIFHPSLPIIISGSEDSYFKIWNSKNFQLIRTLDYGMGRCWSVDIHKMNRTVAFGYDKGLVIIKLGKDKPTISMDKNGKIVYSSNYEVKLMNLKTVSFDEIVDGENVQPSTKDLGNIEIYPKELQHSPNGRFVSVLGNGDYTIYTALAWRNKNFGSAKQLVWANEGNVYSILENNDKLKVFKNFNLQYKFDAPFEIKTIYGGVLLGVVSEGFICFYEWETGKIIRRIDVSVTNVIWSQSGELVTIVTDEDSFFALRFNYEEVQLYFEKSVDQKQNEIDQESAEDGIEESFDVLYEINYPTKSGKWIGDCFVFVNSKDNRLCYTTGELVQTLVHLPRLMYILGYLPRYNRVFLADRKGAIVSYKINQKVIEYYTAILRSNFEIADQIIKEIPIENRTQISKFLDQMDLKERALNLAKDPEQKFELAIELGKIEIAEQVADENGTNRMWAKLSDLALEQGNLFLAEKAMLAMNDLNGLLLLYTSTGDRKGIEKLGNLAEKDGKFNIAFSCFFSLAKIDKCLNLLCLEKRYAEATIMARSYKPSKVEEMLKLWKSSLSNEKTEKSKFLKKISNALASPSEYPNLFPNFDIALNVEKSMENENVKLLNSSDYLKFQNNMNRDLIKEYLEKDKENEKEIEKEENNEKENENKDEKKEKEEKKEEEKDEKEEKEDKGEEEKKDEKKDQEEKKEKGEKKEEENEEEEKNDEKENEKQTEKKTEEKEIPIKPKKKDD
ncbi:coatomer subunit beta'-1 [Anaeramoeba flamelloides]|uniref:Coatomer subunit beta' n=1 Tax=Anaeramoeba flamelloides TaxID=1746091 RepID=A0AAV8ACV2_9EUKA|nr:coatomer subunit beta'-1 [Anaeramoeba flamelloides]